MVLGKRREAAPVGPEGADKFGHAQSNEPLKGSKGTVLLFFRSADWLGLPKTVDCCFFWGLFLGYRERLTLLHH
jgi:hypothetical protein